MQNDPEFLEILYEEALEDLPIVMANASDVSFDKSGSSSVSFLSILRRISIFEYLIYRNVQKFKEYLTKSVKVGISLFNRYENGEPIAQSLVSLLAYKSIFDALAADDFKLAKDLAVAMLKNPEINNIKVHPLDFALSHALIAIILDTDDAGSKLESFREQLSKKGNKSFKGFVDAFDAIQNRDNDAFTKSLDEIVKWHVQLKKGVFDHTLDAILCIWGIGLVNLALHKGMKVDFDNIIMPRVLFSNKE